MTVPPWVVGYFVCLFLGWSADRNNARGWHITASSIIGGAGWLTAGTKTLLDGFVGLLLTPFAGLLPADAYTARYGCLMLCACGAFPSSGKR